MKTIVDLVPLIGFFIAYKFQGIIYATIILIILSIITMGILYYNERKIAMVPLMSVIIISLFGGLTIIFDDAIFIKLKPTIINILFAIALIIGNLKDKPLLKMFFNGAIEMENSKWKILSLRYAIFFLILAILNEFIWRNFPEEFWVNFKVFGLLAISTIFIFTQMPFIMKHQLKQ